MMSRALARRGRFLVTDVGAGMADTGEDGNKAGSLCFEQRGHGRMSHERKGERGACSLG